MADDPVFDRANVRELDDGTIEYRASSFGYCIGALVRARLGMTPSAPPDLMLERYQEGHDWEAEVLRAGLGVDWVTVQLDSELERLGTIVEGKNGERQIETGLSWSNKRVTCHPDAIVRHGGDKHLRVSEVKFLGADYYNTIVGRVEREGMLGLGSGYAWQASIEMLTTGLPMLYIIGQKETVEVDGERVVKGLAGPPITYEWDLDDAPYTFRDIKMRVAEVEGWVARGAMPPCVVPFDYPCGYWQEHLPAREVEEIVDEVMVHLLESYDRNARKQVAAKAEAQQIRDDIDARMVEVGVDGGLCAGYKVSRTAARKGNVSWASWAKEVKKKHPEVKDVDEEQYRGEEIEAGLRIERAKG